MMQDSVKSLLTILMITILISSVATHFAIVGIPLHNTISFLAKLAPQLISGVYKNYIAHFALQRSHEHLIVA